jgi:hypothetical protein
LSLARRKVLWIIRVRKSPSNGRKAPAVGIDVLGGYHRPHDIAQESVAFSCGGSHTQRLAAGLAVLYRGAAYPEAGMLMIAAWTVAAEVCINTVRGTKSGFLQGSAIIAIACGITRLRNSTAT